MVTLGLGARLNRAGKGAIEPPAAFTPALNTTLAWYDAGDAGSVNHTSNAVNTLNDLSGNARHVSNTGGNRPTYSNANGKITFDGSDDYLYNNSAFLHARTEKAVYAVVNITNGDNKCILAEASSSSGSPGYCILMTGDTNKMVPYITNDSGGFVKAFTNLSATTVTGGKKLIRLHEKEGLMSLYVNGSIGAPKSYLRVGNTLTLSRFALGARPSSSPGFHGAFELFELIITEDDSFGQQYEGYLAHKHGLTGSLPIGHPYKSVAPLMGDVTDYTPALNTAPLTVALFGDSITNTNTVDFGSLKTYHNDGYFIAYNALAKNRMYLPMANNKGIGGDRLNQMVTRMTDLAALAFDVCFIMGGTNNIANGDNLGDIVNDMDTILNYITLTLGKTAVLVTMMPRTHGSDVAARKQRLNDANDHFINIHGSREGKVISVNIYDSLDNGSDEPITNATYDGLHPTPYAAMLMGQDIATLLAPYFGEGAPDFTSGNLLSNGTMAGTGGSGSGISGSVATGYYFSATAGTPVASKDGDGHQVLTTNHTSTSGDNALSFLQSVTSGYANGDTVYALAMVEVENVANIDKLSLELYLQPDSVQTHWKSFGFSESGYPISESYIAPGVYVISTPPITLTTGSVASIEARLVQQVKDNATLTTSTVTIHGMGIFKL